MSRPIAIGWDHAGRELSHHLIATFPKIEWEKTGESPFNEPNTPPIKDLVHYPRVIPWVVQRVYQGHMGVLICGTGIGMTIAANRYPGVGAALCTEPMMAKMARAHNNANILVLPGRMMSHAMASECLSLFLTTPFEQGRHTYRIAQFDSILAHSCIDDSCD